MDEGSRVGPGVGRTVRENPSRGRFSETLWGQFYVWVSRTILVNVYEELNVTPTQAYLGTI